MRCPRIELSGPEKIGFGLVQPAQFFAQPAAADEHDDVIGLEFQGRSITLGCCGEPAFLLHAQPRSWCASGSVGLSATTRSQQGMAAAKS